MSCQSTTSGQRCKRWAAKGGFVCAFHGGAAIQVKNAARERAILAKAATLGLKHGVPVQDPIAALQDLGGQAVALVDALKQHAADLQRVGTQGGRWGETRKPELQAYLSAIHEAEKILSSLVRLGLAERLVKIDEQRAAMVATVIERVLKSQGVDVTAIDVRSSVARELKLVSAG